MNTLGLVNVLNNDGNVLIDVAQMADNHIQNAAIHNALAEWNETDDPFSPETTQRLIGKLKGEMPSLIAWLSEGNYPKSSLVPELLAYVKMPHPLQVYKNLDLDIIIEDSEKGPAFDVKLSYAGNVEHFKYAHLPVETDKTSVVLSILDAVGFKMQQGLNSKAMKCKVSHHRLDDERLKIDLPKEGKSPTR